MDILCFFQYMLKKLTYVKTNIWYKHPPININLQFGGGISIYSIFLFPFSFSAKQHQMLCYWPGTIRFLLWSPASFYRNALCSALMLIFWWSEKHWCSSGVTDPDNSSAQNRPRGAFYDSLESRPKEKQEDEKLCF